MDFYTKNPIQIISLEELTHLEDIWIYADEKELEQLEDVGLKFRETISADHFRITRLSLKFLSPNTRVNTLSKRYLVHIN